MLTFLKNAFRRSLKTYPVLTNTVVYASFYAAADVSQQTFKRLHSVDSSLKPAYNLVETAKLATVGSLVYAPGLYYWFRYLDSKFPGNAVKSVVTKVVADQGFMSPIMLASFYIAMAIVERRQDLFEEIREKYWKTYLANQTFWIPAQSVNFYFVPPYLRVVYIATVSFLWINILCYIKRQKLAKDL